MRAAAQEPDANAVREEVGRILASVAFDASERNRDFLRYVVEETLAGRVARTKTYSIATSVFGRGADFDPQLDSIVRIEAGRLRRALDRYYLTPGHAGELRITIPRGAYVPVFVNGAAAGTPTAGRAPGRRGCAILVQPFEEEGDQSDSRVSPPPPRAPLPRSSGSPPPCPCRHAGPTPAAAG